MPHTNTTALVLTLVGAPRWQCGAAGGVLSRADAAWLALLALDGEQPRDRLAAWLWPAAPLKNANLNLRQRLHRLRRETGHALVDAGLTLRLAEGVATDLDGEPPVDGELLGGFDYGDCEALDDWVQAARRRLQARQLDALAGRAARHEAAGELAAALADGERLVARAPLHEHAWRRLMRLHFLRGDRAAAIDAFERFEKLVREEQGSRPSPETIEQLRAIERMDAAAPASPGVLPAVLLRPPALVGREGPLQALALAWQAGRAALVIGGAGSGKSRLVADFLRGRGGVLVVPARPGDEAMPYALAARLLGEALERHAPVLEAAVRAELARLLPALGPAPVGAGQQHVLWQAVESALVACRKNGLHALAVDDLQFADQASQELLRWLLASTRLEGLRFVFGTRPAEAAGGGAAARIKDWPGDSSRIEPVPLRPWSLDEVRQLLQTLALPGVAADTWAPALHQHAGGHPCFTLETLKALWREGGAVDPTMLPLPANVQAMIQHRLTGLPPAAVDLLRLAAVAGSGLQLAWAARLLQRPLHELATTWSELEAMQVLQGQGFAHELVRQAALAMVPPSVRTALHLALAEAGAADPAAQPAVVAGHWLAAGAWAAAAPWLRRAADTARRTGRLAEAQDLLERAADACRRAGDEAGAFDAECETLSGITIRLGSAAALERIAALEAALDATPARASPAAAEARAVPTAPAAPVYGPQAAQQARLLVARSEALLNLARFDEALQAAASAQHAAVAGSALQVDACALHGRALALTGRAAEAVDMLHQARAAAQTLADPVRLLAARSALAHALFADGRLGQARAEQAAAQALAAELGDPAELAQATGNLAMLAYLAGDTAEAHRQAQDAHRRFVAMAAQNAAHGVFNRIVLGRSAAHLGRLDEALAVLQQAAQVPAAQTGDTGAAMARIALAACWLWLGQPVRSLDTLEALPDDVHPMAQLGAWQVRARGLEALGRGTSAVQARIAGLLAAHPALLDDPVLVLEWARVAPRSLALQRLQAAAAACREGGRAGLARSLELRRVDRLLEDAADTAEAADAARRLQRELLPRGAHGGAEPLFAASYPPELGWTLARAQRGRAAAACLAQAVAWLRDTALPGLDAHWHAEFIAGHPVNRAVWAAAGLALPAR